MVVVPVATNIDEVNALEVCEEDLEREVGDHGGSLFIVVADGNWGDLLLDDGGVCVGLSGVSLEDALEIGVVFLVHGLVLDVNMWISGLLFL